MTLPARVWLEQMEKALERDPEQRLVDWVADVWARVDEGRAIGEAILNSKETDR